MRKLEGGIERKGKEGDEKRGRKIDGKLKYGERKNKTEE